MKQVWDSLSVACQFLTILPFPFPAGSSVPPRTLASSFVWFPIVGFILGTGLLFLDRVLGMFLDVFVQNMVLLALYVWVTGGLHQDGLADTLDAIAGGKNPEQRLRILRDSHVGALGVTGLILSLGLRFVGLVALPSGAREAVLIGMPALGRWSMVAGAWRVTAAREDGLGANFLRGMTDSIFWSASGILLVGFIVGFGGMAFGILMGGLVLVRLMVWKFTKTFGGITGDVLGMINECVEIVFLVAAPLIMKAA